MKRAEKTGAKNTHKCKLSEDELEEIITNFKSNHRPLASRKSILDPYRNLILQLYSDLYSYGQISEFLSLIGIDAHSTTVGRFISKKILSTDSLPINKIIVSKEKDVVTSKINQNRLSSLQRKQSNSVKYEPFKNSDSEE